MMAMSACLSNNDISQSTQSKGVIKPTIKQSNTDVVDDVHEQIDDMLQNVPLLGKTFSITNKIGSGQYQDSFNRNWPINLARGRIVGGHNVFCGGQYMFSCSERVWHIKLCFINAVLLFHFAHQWWTN